MSGGNTEGDLSLSCTLKIIKKRKKRGIVRVKGLSEPENNL